MSIHLFFYEHPVFRREEFAAWKTAQGTPEPHAVDESLQHYLKSGRIVRLRRELYAVVPPDQTPEVFSADAYLIAGKAATDSLLAYHTALELHGLAYSIFHQFTFLTQYKIKPFICQQQQFQPIAIPIALCKQKSEDFAVMTINRQGVEVRLTNVARTFVDILDRAEISGGWEEVCRAINSIAVLNIDEVITYCLKLKNARLVAKVGFFLEQRKGAFIVSKEQLQELIAAKPKTPEYLSRKESQEGLLIKKWNLIVPKNILNPSWEEPHADI